MANLIVTFGKTGGGGAYVPLERIASSRTELLPIGSDTQITATEATASENMVTLYAEADCWIAASVGQNNAAPDPTGDGRRFMKEGTERQFAVERGTAIAVIAN